MSWIGDLVSETVVKALSTARKTFESGRTRDASWREKQLDGLIRLLEENDERLIAALDADLGKPRAEGWTTDLGTTATEISYIRKNIRKYNTSCISIYCILNLC